jgi:hypothetical protein
VVEVVMVVIAVEPKAQKIMGFWRQRIYDGGFRVLRRRWQVLCSGGGVLGDGGSSSAAATGF